MRGDAEELRAVLPADTLIDQAEERGFIHRDYIAHCLRWTHVAKWMGNPKNRKDCNLLDIGCGKDVPLAKMLMTSRMASDGLVYIGIDYNKLEMPKAFENTKFKPVLIGNVAFPDCTLPYEKFDVITSFGPCRSMSWRRRRCACR
mgnify:CR=1 FL=1